MLYWRIKDLREDSDKTQAEVAAAIGLACYSFGPKGGKPIFKMVWCVVEIIFLTSLGMVSINGGGAI